MRKPHLASNRGAKEEIEQAEAIIQPELAVDNWV